jgi:hypothetical protein
LTCSGGFNRMVCVSVMPACCWPGAASGISSAARPRQRRVREPAFSQIAPDRVTIGSPLRLKESSRRRRKAGGNASAFCTPAQAGWLLVTAVRLNLVIARVVVGGPVWWLYLYSLPTRREGSLRGCSRAADCFSLGAQPRRPVANS